ncbi:MAG: BMP family ABC transporter substrate-binding protein [Spirochaetia bacterium]|jgi:simple sugar transport system substrate-binding protein|nr:BMP family ABC transporter substrate-binding protein [Spirochaetales bacterium]MDX9783790.1 BMP family ABC transporter substrate-binding protein [Spirochaetia bacterium]
MPRRLLAVLFSLFLALPLIAAPLKIGVFIPGQREGSPIYDSLAAGAEQFAAENPGSSVRVFEAGFNQAEWQEKLTSFVGSGRFDVILTSNPSLPDLIEAVTPLFPSQKFICLDGYKAGISSLHTVLYNQTEQGYIAGYLAGLVSSSSLSGANAHKKAGMIIGQHYPVMDKLIAPGFEQGLKAVDPSFSLDIRVLGNWYDATKASDLAKSMIASGVDVILPVCGSASQGVVKAAKDLNRYLVFFDSDEYARAPGTIIGCVALGQKELGYAKLKEFAQKATPWGRADIVGVKEGYIELLDKHPSYIEYLPQSIRDRMSKLIARIASGDLSFSAPKL